MPDNPSDANIGRARVVPEHRLVLGLGAVPIWCRRGSARSAGGQALVAEAVRFELTDGMNRRRFSRPVP